MKQLRLQRGWTLQQLSERCSVSPSMLSEIERGRKSPSLEIACRIAEALDVNLSELLETRPPEPITVIRPADRTVVREPNGFERHVLLPRLPDSRLDLALNVIPAGASSPVFPPHARGVRETIHVIEGELEMRLGTRVTVLYAGDTATFVADETHQFINRGKSVCRYLLVIDAYGRQREDG